MNNPKRKGSAFYSLREHRLCSASPRRFEPKDSDNKIKKESTKSEFFFLVGTIGLEKALPFIRYANTDYVRLRRGGSSLKIVIKIKKESTKSEFFFLVGTIGLEPMTLCL